MIVMFEIDSRICSLLAAIVISPDIYVSLNPYQAGQAAFVAFIASTVRTSFAVGSASVRTNFVTGAFSTPSSIERACALVGRLATRSISEAA